MQRRGKQAQMRACLCAWQELAQHLLWSRQRLTTKVLGLSNQTTLSAAFSNWCREAADKHQLRAIEASVGHKHKSCTLNRLLQVPLPSCLSSWLMTRPTCSSQIKLPTDISDPDLELACVHLAKALLVVCSNAVDMANAVGLVGWLPVLYNIDLP